MFSSYTDSELEATGWDPASLPANDGDEATHLWSELGGPDCPAEEIKLAGPDDQSGTYEYFLETILTDADNGETFPVEGRGYFNSADDEEIIAYLKDNLDAIAFFGYAYYYDEIEHLEAAAILNSDGDYVKPTPDTVGGGSYNPLARRIYMNFLNDETALKLTQPFLEYGFNNDDLTASTGYVPIPADEKNTLLSRVAVE